MLLNLFLFSHGVGIHTMTHMCHNVHVDSILFCHCGFVPEVKLRLSCLAAETFALGAISSAQKNLKYHCSKCYCTSNLLKYFSFSCPSNSAFTAVKWVPLTCRKHSTAGDVHHSGSLQRCRGRAVHHQTLWLSFMSEEARSRKYSSPKCVY